MGADMPDQAPAPEGGVGRGTLIVGAIALSIAVAGIAFGVGRLTAPAEETEPEAGVEVVETTTTSVAIETVGETLSWSESGDIGERWPVALLEHDGMVYFFGTASAPFGFEQEEGSGVDAWESGDGSSWESLGSVIGPPAEVREVVSTPQGLIAMGTDADGGGVVWMSQDARQWSTSRLPTDGTSQPGTQFDLTAAGANDEVVVVFGSSFVNPDQMIMDAIGEDFDEFGMGFGGPAGPFTIYGPLGLPVASYTAEELGIDPEQLQLLFEDQGGEMSTVWSSTDGATWIASEFGEGQVMSVSTNEDGELVAVGYGMFGVEAWTSTDGVEWTSQGTVGEVDSLTPWNDGFVAVSYFGPSGEIVYSDDGEDWEPLGTEQLLPDELDWSYWPLSAGGAGIATVAHGYDESMGFGFEEPEPIELEQDGYTLTIDQMRGTIRVTEGETVLLRIGMGSERVSDDVMVDLEARTLTFLHPESGAALMTFTFDELEDAEAAAFGGMEEGPMDIQVFLFSPEGSEWSAQDLVDITAEESSVDGLHVMDDRVVAMLLSGFESSFGPPSTPYVRLWTGLVP